MFVYRKLSLVQVIVLFHFAAEYIMLTTPGASESAPGMPPSSGGRPKPHLDKDASARQSLAVAGMLQHFNKDF